MTPTTPPPTTTTTPPPTTTTTPPPTTTQPPPTQNEPPPTTTTTTTTTVGAWEITNDPEGDNAGLIITGYVADVNGIAYGNAISGMGGDDLIIADTPDNIGAFTSATDTGITPTFSGSAERDAIAGGGGNDYIYGGPGDDSITGDIPDTTTGSEGNDLDILLASGVVDFGSGTAGNDHIYGGAGNDDISGDDGDDYLYGEADNDSIDGDAGADYIDGGTGNDDISGDDGNDTIYGGDGSDFIDGGTGDDSLSGDAGIDYIFGNDGADVIYGGADNDSLFGGPGNDIIYGNDGDDVLNGGTGIDALVGGLGDDIYVIDDSSDSITESAGEGSDYVISSVSYTLPTNVEHLALDGIADIDGTGNADSNILLGNDGANVLNGAGGVDVVSAGAGDDWVDAGYSGTGGAVYDGETGTDTLSFVNMGYGVTADLSSGGVIYNGLTDSMSNFEVLDGSYYDDILTGDSSDNTLIGQIGADTLDGGEGNDTYKLNSGDFDSGEQIADSGASGTDNLILAAGGTFDLSLGTVTGIEILTLNAAGNSVTFDNTQTQQFSTIQGDAGTDTLTLGTANSGMDLTGVVLTDVENIALGSGDEWVNLDDASVGVLGSMTIDGGTGTDTVQLFLQTENGTLDASGLTLTNVENVLIQSVEDTAENSSYTGLHHTLIGTAQADTILGGDGDDTLTGNAGADILEGGLGIDTLTGGSGSDIFKFLLSDFDQGTGIDGINYDVINDYSTDGDTFFMYTSATSVNGLALSSTLANLLYNYSYGWQGNFVAVGVATTSMSNITATYASFTAALNAFSAKSFGSYTGGVVHGSQINSLGIGPNQDVFLFFHNNSGESELWHAGTYGATDTSYSQVAVFSDNASLDAFSIYVASTNMQMA